MFEIVGNSATQIYNKEISLSLSLSSENLVVCPCWCKYKISFDGWASKASDIKKSAIHFSFQLGQ